MNLAKRKIANTDLATYPLVLGGNVFGWTSDEKTSFAILDEYIDKGFNAIDTADAYSAWVPGNKGGESETILGKWLNRHNNRAKIILATKVGAAINTTHKGLARKYIVAEVEESLRRLQTDYIDLYYTHYDDLSLPVADILETYAILIRQGKVRYIGTSNMSAARIEQSMDAAKQNNLPAYSVLQPEYNLYDKTTYETEYQPLVKKYGFAVFPYYSLASGFLTGKYHSKTDIINSKRSDKLDKYFDDRGINLLNTLQTIAEAKSVSPSQLALAWLMQQPTVTAPIASVSKPEQLDILEAVNIELTPEELSILNKI